MLLLADEGLLTLKEVIHRWDEDRIIRRTLHFCMGKCDKNSEGKKMVTQLEEMWEYAQSIAENEDKDPEPPKFKKN